MSSTIPAIRGPLNTSGRLPAGCSLRLIAPTDLTAIFVLLYTIHRLLEERRVEHMVVKRQVSGVGVVFINGVGIWALWVRELPYSCKVRMSCDDLDSLGIHEYQRVRIKLTREYEVDLYLRGRRESPPFVWLDLGRDVRRVIS